MNSSAATNATQSSFAEKVYNIAILGESGVGKSDFCLSSLRENYKFSQNSKPTIGVDLFFSKKSAENLLFKYAIWDYNGQIRYQSGESQIKPMDAYILVYDITKRDSYESLKEWMKYVESKDSVQKPLYFIVGNKLDLDLQREVNPDEVEEFSKMNNVEFFEVSSKYQKFTKTTMDRIMNIVSGTIQSGRDIKMEEEVSKCECCTCKIF